MKYFSVPLCIILSISFEACVSPVAFFKDIPISEGQKVNFLTDIEKATVATRQILTAHDFSVKEDTKLPNGTHCIIAEHISTNIIESKDPYPSGLIRVLIDARAGDSAQVNVYFKPGLRKDLKEKIAKETERATRRFFMDLEKRLPHLVKN